MNKAVSCFFLVITLISIYGQLYKVLGFPFYFKVRHVY